MRFGPAATANVRKIEMGNVKSDVCQAEEKSSQQIVNFHQQTFFFLLARVLSSHPWYLVCTFDVLQSIYSHPLLHPISKILNQSFVRVLSSPRGFRFQSVWKFNSILHLSFSVCVVPVSSSAGSVQYGRSNPIWILLTTFFSVLVDV